MPHLNILCTSSQKQNYTYDLNKFKHAVQYCVLFRQNSQSALIIVVNYYSHTNYT